MIDKKLSTIIVCLLFIILSYSEERNDVVKNENIKLRTK